MFLTDYKKLQGKTPQIWSVWAVARRETTKIQGVDMSAYPVLLRFILRMHL